ncbi:LecA/PA-IL family lectin, partial [Pseudomonas aeruginosa]
MFPFRPKRVEAGQVTSIIYNPGDVITIVAAG